MADSCKNSFPYKIMLSAGEPSGDLHAAGFFLELKKRLPSISGIGMGGLHMKEAGIDVRYDSTSIAVMGLSDVLGKYWEIRRVLKNVQEMVLSERPDLLICVDYKEFNLRLAQKAKAAGIKVLFYVSPQVWAWRSGRVKTYGKAIDAMAVLFPFEVPYYEKENVPCQYVGHPLVDSVKPLSCSIDSARETFALSNQEKVIGVMPGSRPSELKRLLPIMLQAAEKISDRHKDARFLLIKAKSVTAMEVESAVVALGDKLRVIDEKQHDAMMCCDAIMTSSGTATLELALLGVPMCIVYRLPFWNYCLARMLVKVKFIGLPNIIAGHSVVREFIQHHATANNLSKEVCKIIEDDTYREGIKRGLRDVQNSLGEGGGTGRLADMATELLIQN